jgi:ribosomal protein S2
LKTNKNILFLDSRASFLQVIDFFIKGSKKKLESFQGLTLKGLLTNFKSNQNFCKGYGYSSLLNKPDMLIVFDSLENLDLLKEANIAGIPVICFTDINKSYSNIYNISFNSNFRNFIMLLVTIQKLLFFAKHLSYR